MNCDKRLTLTQLRYFYVVLQHELTSIMCTARRSETRHQANSRPEFATIHSQTNSSKVPESFGNLLQNYFRFLCISNKAAARPREPGNRNWRLAPLFRSLSLRSILRHGIGKPSQPQILIPTTRFEEKIPNRVTHKSCTD